MSTKKPFVSNPPDEEPLALQLRSLGLYVMAERYQSLAEEATRTKIPYTHRQTS